MFTGIIETVGKVSHLEKENSNLHITLESEISKSLKIDQSLAHNGVCLTVVAQDDHCHTVTAIEETLNRSNLGILQTGENVNLERCVTAGTRLDGHIVQGHVDDTGICRRIRNAGGSRYFTFEYNRCYSHLLIDKGSVTINGVSLTVIEPSLHEFTVAVIPYTFEHTNFQFFEKDSIVNLEFDILGKYFARYMDVFRNKANSIH